MEVTSGKSAGRKQVASSAATQGSGPHLPDILAQTVGFALASFLLPIWPRVHFGRALLRKGETLSPGAQEDSILDFRRASQLVDRFLLSASSSFLTNGHRDARQEEYTRTFPSSGVFSRCRDNQFPREKQRQLIKATDFVVAVRFHLSTPSWLCPLSIQFYLITITMLSRSCIIP